MALSTAFLSFGAKWKTDGMTDEDDILSTLGKNHDLGQNQGTSEL